MHYISNNLTEVFNRFVNTQHSLNSAFVKIDDVAFTVIMYTLHSTHVTLRRMNFVQKCSDGAFFKNIIGTFVERTLTQTMQLDKVQLLQSAETVTVIMENHSFFFFCFKLFVSTFGSINFFPEFPLIKSTNRFKIILGNRIYRLRLIGIAFN